MSDSPAEAEPNNSTLKSRTTLLIYYRPNSYFSLHFTRNTRIFYTPQNWPLNIRNLSLLADVSANKKFFFLNWIFTTLSKWYSKSVWTSMLYECLMYQRALWHLNTLKYSRLCFSSFSIASQMLKMWLMRRRVRPRRKEKCIFACSGYFMAKCYM